MKRIYTLLFALIFTASIYAQTEVTFRVDMNTTAADAAGVFITGSWMEAAGLGGNWQEPSSNTDAQLLDMDGDGVYTLTVMLAEGDYQYKYANGSGWPNAEAGGGGDNYQADLSTCGGTDNGYGGYNRNLTVAGTDPIRLDAFLFNSCDLSLVNTTNLSTIEGVTLSPNPASYNVEIRLQSSDLSSHLVTVYNMTGQLIEQRNMGNAEFMNINLANYAKGMYIVTFQNELGEVGSEKLIVE